MMFNFEPYPFEKLRALYAPLHAHHGLAPLSLTIGEPQFETPLFIQDSFCHHAKELNKYPKTAGESFLNDALLTFHRQRFGITLTSEQVIPCAGTREALFNFPQYYLHDKEKPLMVYPNPFYQIYEGAAKACRADVFHLPLLEQNRFLPDIEMFERALKQGLRPHLVILNSPSNPTGAVMGLDELALWVELALRYDFVVINDECYNEIYFERKPASILEASLKIGNSDFKNVLAMNSISKRSSSPGLRAGFVAGDSSLLSGYLTYRTYVGCASSLPVQHASSVAWTDEEHVTKARELYRENFVIARELLGITPPDATFYLWLNVKNGIDCAKKLYEKGNIQVLPGTFLARGNVADEYIRIALVYDNERTWEALKRIREILL